MRIFHYRVGAISAAFLVVSAATGLLWAYAPYLYWQPGYMEKKAPVKASLSEAVLEVKEVLEVLEARAVATERIESLTLRSDAGLLLYEAALAGPTEHVLIDGRSGSVLSPLSAELAEQLSRQYLAGSPQLASSSFEQPWKDRKGKTHQAAWRLSFGDEAGTELVIDAHAGKLLEDSDKIRRFHFWIMDLHQFNFFGTRKVLSAVSGVPLLILSVTGFALAWKRLRFNRRRRKQSVTVAAERVTLALN